MDQVGLSSKRNQQPASSPKNQTMPRTSTKKKKRSVAVTSNLKELSRTIYGPLRGVLHSHKRVNLEKYFSQISQHFTDFTDFTWID